MPRLSCVIACQRGQSEANRYMTGSFDHLSSNRVQFQCEQSFSFLRRASSRVVLGSGIYRRATATGASIAAECTTEDCKRISGRPEACGETGRSACTPETAGVEACGLGLEGLAPMCCGGCSNQSSRPHESWPLSAGELALDPGRLGGPCATHWGCGIHKMAALETCTEVRASKACATYPAVLEVTPASLQRATWLSHGVEPTKFVLHDGRP